jgi:hypothetical protein
LFAPWHKPTAQAFLEALHAEQAPAPLETT